MKWLYVVSRKKKKNMYNPEDFVVEHYFQQTELGCSNFVGCPWDRN